MRFAWDDIPRPARVLGLAGIAPQAFAVIAALSPTWRFTALSAGFLYGALILSFVGGVWWGVASTNPKAPKWVYLVAVAPSLIALATGIPWMVGALWPWPSLAVLGTALMVSPIMDMKLRSLDLISDAVLCFRIVLSVGIGIMTGLLAFL